MVAMKSNVKQFYRDYFNGKYFRDLRYIIDSSVNVKGEKSKYNTKVLKYPDGDFNAPKYFLSFLLKWYNKGTGSLIAGISHYKNFTSHRDKNQFGLMCDKLFFDFDVESERCKDLKHKMKDVKLNPDVTGKNRVKLVEEYQKEFRTLIFERDLLYEPFNEVMKLKEYLFNNGINSFIVFSGSKGFHLNIFFKEANLLDITNLNMALADIFKRKLDLNLLDYNIYNNVLAGMQRVPYSVHERTGLRNTTVCENICYDDFLNEIRRNKPTVESFNIEDYYAPDSFRELLIKINSKNMQQEEENKIKREELKELRRNNQSITNYKNDKSLIFKDMRELCKVLIGEPAYERQDYNKYNCPFHDDRVPSAIAGKRYFTCYGCNLKLNYFEFIRKFFKLESDDEVKKKMKELTKM